jgi:hypothetical protein
VTAGAWGARKRPISMGTGSKSARNSWPEAPDSVARWAALKEPNTKSHPFLCEEQ